MRNSQRILWALVLSIIYASGSVIYFLAGFPYDRASFLAGGWVDWILGTPWYPILGVAFGTGATQAYILAGGMFLALWLFIWSLLKWVSGILRT